MNLTIFCVFISGGDFIINIYETALTRNLVDTTDIAKFQSASRGFEGEIEFSRWLNGFTGFHILKDLYLTSRETCQVDFLLLSQNRWVVFEVKNYAGPVRITSEDVYLFGKKLESDPLYRSRRMLNIVESIVSEVVPNVTIDYLMVFIHEDCHVEIEDNRGFTILRRSQLREYLKELKYQLQFSEYSHSQFQEILRSLKPFALKTQRDYMEYNLFRWQQLKRGLTCPECNQFTLEKRKKSHYCYHCQKSFTKGNILEKAIDDYCRLKNQSHFTTEAINDFIGGEINKYSMSKYLKHNYPLEDDAQMKNYINPKAIDSLEDLTNWSS